MALFLALLVGLSAAQERASTKARLLNGNQIMSADDYPIESLRKNESGAVTVKLAVNPSGAITSCTIVKSSGHSALDEKTCALFQERGKFQPATDDSGNAIASEVTQKVGWKLVDNEMSMPRTDWMMRMTVALGSDGGIISCKFDSSGLVARPGNCSMPGRHSMDASPVPTGYAINETFFYSADPDSAPKAPDLSGAQLASRQVSRVTISPDGQVIACAPVSYSGSSSVQRDRCDTVSNFRFAPAAEGSGPFIGTLVQSDYVSGTAAN